MAFSRKKFEVDKTIKQLNTMHAKSVFKKMDQ